MKRSYMTAGELIAALKKQPPNTPVVLSSDPEGNGYLHLSQAGPAVFDDGTIYLHEWSASDNGLEETEWRALKKDKNKHVIVLHP